MPIPPLLVAFCLLALTFVLYALGIVRAWGRAGFGRGVAAWRAACFVTGMMLLAADLTRPMDDLADRSLAAHMVQHLLLMKVIPPLLLLGQFSAVLLRAVGPGLAHRLSAAWTRRRRLRLLWRRLTAPWFAWGFYSISLWAWHAPAFYQAALSNEWLHVIEHATFLFSSLLFWWYLLQPGREPSVRLGAAVLYIFTTLLHEGLLGALLTFAARPWYRFYAAGAAWGLTPLGDQQLAGLIMWVPGGLLLSGVAVYFFAAWLQAIERRADATRPKYQ